jgi:hypothetical protein
VYREHASSHDIVNFTKTARDILIAFNDSQGALMAHKYIAIYLEIAAGMERNKKFTYYRKLRRERPKQPDE